MALLAALVGLGFNAWPETWAPLRERLMSKGLPWSHTPFPYAAAGP